MTESRDQRFFDALNNAGDDEDDDPTMVVPKTARPGGEARPAAPTDPPPGLAGDESQDDPASGRHHIDLRTARPVMHGVSRRGRPTGASPGSRQDLTRSQGHP
ncbi:hypothetical protein MARA_03380 (plasmid) [Mycolicibacterium arabiense]|uniref:Uncharacterized protein n=1 Tax=Mycolicibacterium arabiense TaxID=1286181 RepID=A0A7I7RQR6_9MYCO|nr:hypothetical protein MARA_03380 [Mycolicibacterium arabiense]